ncbi:hypothetical protein CGRA01v4_00443 [Colletotrichum graminicola]|nr:hypothetical protein CGRA01v4_00443 [Colletotrichum graminicola]
MVFEEMIKGPTLDWISEQLKTCGLSIDEVPILDICSFFSDDDLEEMGSKERYEAVNASYGLALDILAILKPEVILCCQCTTKGYWEHGREVRRPAADPLARRLCSSIDDTKMERAEPIDIRGHTAWVVKGFHPGHLVHRPDREPVLIRLFGEIFEPYGRWKRRVISETLEEMTNKIDMLISNLELHKSKLDGVCWNKTLVKGTSELIAALVKHKEGIQSVMQHLKRS